LIQLASHLSMNTKALLSKAQLVDDHSISLYLVIFEVIEESPPLAHKLQQTPPGVMIPFVDLKMFSEISDTVTEQGDLDLW